VVHLVGGGRGAESLNRINVENRTVGVQWGKPLRTQSVPNKELRDRPFPLLEEMPVAVPGLVDRARDEGESVNTKDREIRIWVRSCVRRLGPWCLT